MASEKKGGAKTLAAFYDEGAYTPLFGGGQGAVLAGYGMVGGRPAYAVCQVGEAVSAADVKAGCKTAKLAAKTGNPIVTFYNSPGMKLEDGLATLKAAARLNEVSAVVSGVVPQIAVVTGVCGASSALAAAGADICIMTRDAQLFLTPPFIARAQGDNTEGAGSADFAEKAGVAAMVAEDEAAAIAMAARLVMLLPANNISPAGSFEFSLPAAALNEAKYSAMGAVEALADGGSVAELFGGFATGLVTAFATVGGNTAGFVSTGGPGTALCAKCAGKAARFVRLCDAFNIPVVSVLNTDGFVKANADELAGGIRAAARLAATYADATTAKVNVVTGKLVGAAYSAFAAADLTIAMEGCVIAPAEPSAVVTVLYKEEITASGKPIEAITAELAKKYSQDIAGADAAVEAGIADFAAGPAALRSTLSAALALLESKRVQRLPKKHGNMAL